MPIRNVLAALGALALGVTILAAPAYADPHGDRGRGGEHGGGYDRGGWRGGEHGDGWRGGDEGWGGNRWSRDGWRGRQGYGFGYGAPPPVYYAPQPQPYYAPPGIGMFLPFR